MKDVLSSVIAGTIWLGICCFVIFTTAAIIVVIGVAAAVVFLPLLFVGGIYGAVLWLWRRFT